MVTNADGVLVINFRSRQAMAGNRGYVVKHLFGRRAHVWQAVLAAWLTRAPAVTMEQMLAFVGPDAVPAEGRKGG